MISFGTSGWRAVIADEFTIHNVRRVAQAVADYLFSEQKTFPSKEIIIGYDTRFMSEDFGKVAAEIFAANGFFVSYSNDAVPTPTIACEIIRRKAAGGINITASHNPPQYNGIKFSPSWGGPALPETTRLIEENCRAIENNPNAIKIVAFDDAVKAKKITVRSFKKTYFTRIEQLIDFDAIRRSKLHITADVMHGAARGYLDELLENNRIPHIAINTNRDCLFDGHRPEPNGEHLARLVSMVKSHTRTFGVATDGDADRFGIIDIDGTYIAPNDILAVLLDHLVRTRKWNGVAARSVMTSSFIDAVAQYHGVAMRETPVGFKYIGDILIKEPLIIGGEESAGLTIRGHVPEKDGILAGLLVAEMVAMSKKSVRAIINELSKKVGTFLTARMNYRLSDDAVRGIKTMFANNPPKTIAGNHVAKLVTLDGYKCVFDSGEWVGIRLSGTEPVVRCYIEAHSKKALTVLQHAMQTMIQTQK